MITINDSNGNTTILFPLVRQKHGADNTQWKKRDVCKKKMISLVIFIGRITILIFLIEQC